MYTNICFCENSQIVIFYFYYLQRMKDWFSCPISASYTIDGSGKDGLKENFESFCEKSLYQTHLYCQQGLPQK